MKGILFSLKSIYQGAFPKLIFPFQKGLAVMHMVFDRATLVFLMIFGGL